MAKTLRMMPRMIMAVASVQKIDGSRLHQPPRREPDHSSLSCEAESVRTVLRLAAVAAGAICVA
jgi:hypothetical protein